MTLVLSPEVPHHGVNVETPSPLAQKSVFNDDLDITSLTPISSVTTVLANDNPSTPQENIDLDAIDKTPITTPGTDSSELDSTATSLLGTSTETTPLKKSKRRRRRRGTKKKKNAVESETSTGAETTVDSIPEEFPAKSLSTSPTKAGTATTNSVDLNGTTTTGNSNPFNILLRSTKSNLNGKYNSTLLEAPLVKTIIGIPRQQILRLPINDVKIKTIIAKASKLTANILGFVQKHSDTFFADDTNKKMFFKLCIAVALYESHGFRKINAEYPVLEMIGGYDEITLDTTGTKLTPSSNKVHQNNLDYAVLAYIGHILIWVVFLQRQARVPLFIDAYDIELTQTTVRQHVGGVHLWSKLIRESETMNAKRWKHIYKFRQMFPFEEDQFMLIVRFMHIEGEIP